MKLKFPPFPLAGSGFCTHLASRRLATRRYSTFTWIAFGFASGFLGSETTSRPLRDSA